MTDQSPTSQASCPQCGRQLEWVWAVSINQSLPPGFTPIFTPEKRDVARCGECAQSFERTDGGAWRPQDASS